MPQTHDGQDEDCVYAGHYGRVKFARAVDGTLMVKPAWDVQSSQWKKAFMGRFAAITSEKSLILRNVEMFKQISGDLYEFKHNGQQSRIFTFREQLCWYLVDVYTEKKEDDLPTGVVKRANEKMQEAKNVLAKNGKGTGR